MPLRLALLDLDSDVLAIVRAAALDPRFEITQLGVAAPPCDEVRLYAPLAPCDPQWETLLLGNLVEAVVVASSPDRELRAEQLRKLTQAKIPLLLVPPACEAIVGFEVDMIRQDTGCVLVPYLPGGGHPAIAELASYATSAVDSPLGRIEQLVFERKVFDRGRQSVLAQLTRDVGLVRKIVGNLTKVSAMGASAGEMPLANLSVNLSGPSSVLIRWSVGPMEGEPLGKIVLVGAKGSATLTMPISESAWQLDSPAYPEGPRTWPDANSPAAALEELLQSLSGVQTGATWLEACRDVEVAETAERSATRGRTIELYQEEHSEQETFKGVMSVGGCLVLLFALVGLFISFGIGGVQMLLRDPDAKVEHTPWPFWLRLWPVYPLAFFLLLQLLQLVFKPVKKPASSEPNQAESLP